MASFIGAAGLILPPPAWVAAVSVSWRNLLGNERPAETTRWRKSRDL